jgi:hypothetical protein
MLEEAILVAGIRHESRSPVLLVPSRSRVKGEVSLSGIPISHKLAGREDLPMQLKSEITKGKFLWE